MKTKLLLSLAIAILISGFARIPNNTKTRQDGGMSLEAFLKKIDNKEKIVLVYFKADWCLPCVKLKPIMEQLATEEKEKVEILTIDTEENKDLSLHFEINTLPLFFIYKNGKKVWENNTFLSKADIQKKLDLYK